MMTMGDVSVLIPSTYPSSTAMVLKTGASKAQHATLAKLAFSLVGEPMLFDLVEAAKNPTEDAAAAARCYSKKSAPVVVPQPPRRMRRRPGLVVATFEWPASTIKTAHVYTIAAEDAARPQRIKERY